MTSGNGIKNVGVMYNNFNVNIKSGEADVTDEYKITYVNGTLKVIPRPITLTAESATASYTGSELTCERIKELEPGALASGDYIGHYKVVGSQTELGKSDNVIKEIIIRNLEGEDVTSNYSIILEKGQLKVTR
jgi:hypothetical protein